MRRVEESTTELAKAKISADYRSDDGQELPGLSKMTCRLIDLACGFLSFLLPLAIVLILLSALGFYPFDPNGHTLLMLDAQSQYFPFFRNLKSALENGESLIYTFSKALGGDFLSLYAYYLASPWNFLIVFFPYETLPSFFTFLFVLKVSLSGLTMWLCLRFGGQAKAGQSLLLLLFSTSYAFCTYTFSHEFNIMFLDGVVGLPLVVLGIELLFKDKCKWLYPLALAYCLISQWYIGAFVCLFAVFFSCSLWLGEAGRKAAPPIPR